MASRSVRGGRLEGRVAVITGGASGIGAATVRLFIEEGARVVIVDIDRKLGEALAKELGEACVFVETDLSKPEQIRAFVQTTVYTFGRLDILFNNAGIAPVGDTVVDCPEETFARTLQLNLTAVWLAMKYAIPEMQKIGGGSIISTSSIGALVGLPLQCAYGPSKAAVIQLTRNCAIDHAAQGIRVNCICPGGTYTPLSYTNRTDASEEQILADLATRQPIRRPGMPRDIANAALWLASDEFGFVTGQSIIVDGGQTASGSRRQAGSS